MQFLTWLKDLKNATVIVVILMIIFGFWKLLNFAPEDSKELETDKTSVNQELLDQNVDENPTDSAELVDFKECESSQENECVAENGCQGIQHCYDGYWAKSCETQFQKCEDGSCRSSCPICYNGQTQDCVADNGCVGTKKCENENWNGCITSMQKCSDGSCQVTCPVIPVIPTPTPQPVPAPQPSPSYSCNCSKTCTQISSCAEAYYQLNTCGCSVRDGDNDGVPCENLCN